MDWVLTIWSSRIIWMSSMPFRICVPVSRQSMYSKATPIHSPCILSRVRSRLYSLLAYSLTSSMAWMCLGSSSCRARLRLKLSSAFTAKPMALPILSQCRSRRPGFRSATISGRCSWNAFSFS